MESRLKEVGKELCFESSGDAASLSLVEKYDLFLKDNLSESSEEETEDVIRNQLFDYKRHSTSDNELFTCFVPKASSVNIDEPIRHLESIRKTGPDGNSIFCTKSELEAIQDRYGEILDFISDKCKLFERKDHGETVDIESTNTDPRDDMKMLSNKIHSVQQARDKFHDVESQVRELIEQLELVERCKMED